MKNYVILHVIVCCYALWAYFAKCAAAYEWFGINFVLFYGMALLMLSIYGIGWQKILSKLPLGKAYANKSVAVIWYIFIGSMCFGEQLNLRFALGTVLIVAGTLTLSSEHD